MLATMECVEILETAEKIATMVFNSEIADRYFDCLYKIRNSQESQQKIHEFSKMKEQYEDVQRFGRYHPDYQTISKRTRELKRILDLDKNIAEFRIAENELQSLLDELSIIIGHSVSDKIKVPMGNPYFDKLSGCGGGCGSGGSCGCS